MRRYCLLLLAACARPAAAPAPPAGPTTITIIGTNDLHGYVLAKDGDGGLALLGGYLANLRAAGRAVLLLDAGDTFQGTLESNLNEGEAVVRAYGALGYDAMAVGNHELDFGPAGPDVTARKPGDDPRGALRKRMSESRFPILSANLVDETGRPVARPSTLVVRAGIKIGIIGVTTFDTPQSTIAANFMGLRMLPLAETANDEAARLRAAGAQLVVIVAHAGAKCTDPAVESTCQGELVDAARKLRGIDAIVAGHTHAPVATRLSGIPVIESFSYGRAFGRIDLTLTAGKVTAAHVFLPQDVRGDASYEGAPVQADAQIAALLQPYVEAARVRREEKLGVRVGERIRKAYDQESPLGNLFVDWMRQARPGVDVAINNGGAIRNDLQPGELTYGVMFEAFPFDNMVTLVNVTGADLKRILRINLESEKSIISLAGMRAEARCAPGLEVAVMRDDGRPVGDDERIVILTSDFLATGGNDGAFKGLPASAVAVENGVLLREEVVRVLRAHGGEVRAAFEPERPRVRYPGTRPVRCPP